MKPANRIEVKKDGRVLLFGTYYTQMKNKLRELAGRMCEKCGDYCWDGDVHHPNGRGGGRRDDRIFVDGKRNLFYWCRDCHSGHHVPEKVVPAKPTVEEFNELLGL
jgi:hypothetical protein